jgi:hypothetical protein
MGLQGKAVLWTAALLGLSCHGAPFLNSLTWYYYPAHLYETEQIPYTSFQPIPDAALTEYTTGCGKQVGIELAHRPLVDTLRSCGSPDDVLKLPEDMTNCIKHHCDMEDAQHPVCSCYSSTMQTSIFQHPRTGHNWLWLPLQVVWRYRGC